MPISNSQLEAVAATRRSPSVPSFTLDDNGVTFMIVTGAGTAIWTPERIRAEIALGRRVNVIPTPTAAQWLDNNQIRELTGWDMRPIQRLPPTPTFDPPGCRVLATPVGLNTLTKWAAGHCDNLALSLLCEAVGTPGLEVRAEIALSEAYARHPATTEALERLASMDVQLARAFRAARHHLLPEADRPPFDPRHWVDTIASP